MDWASLGEVAWSGIQAAAGSPTFMAFAGAMLGTGTAASLAASESTGQQFAHGVNNGMDQTVTKVEGIS